ncbi:MAG: cation-translocating P-type ATPase [Desulfobacterales bacterium]|nr:cation-translocating P-type ATPase [Desulfobacterales bacterium]
MIKRPNPETSSQTCDLCGLPLRYGTVNTVFSGNTYAFCCNGCRQVFTILMESTDSPNPEAFRETDLFRQCRAMGIIPGSEQELTRADNTHAEAAPLPSAGDRDNVLTLKLLVSNMWCSACAWIIDESLKKTPGVVDSACNFSTDRLQVVYDPVKVTSHQIIESIGKLGYRTAAPGESEKTTERRREFVRFAVSAFLTMNVMMLSFALYTGFFTDLSPENAVKISWPMFVMATAVLIYGGYDFYKKAWAGLRNAAFSMETLILIGALSAYFFSTYNLFAGSIHLYYDTASMLITLVLLGKTLERRAKGKVLEDLENFFALMPTKVRICSGDFPEGRYVAIEQLAAGDIFRVNETDIIPADGQVLSGNGAVEESSLTGEPLPITKKPGDVIRSGARIQQGGFKIRAEKVGTDSTLGQMMQIIEKTLLTKMPIEGKTDVILQWFVPVILVLAAATGMLCRFMGLSLETSILRAVTVMVISCPCALGIAIPLARVAGISIAGKKGILVRNFTAFEMAGRITAFVFDKTGTITLGNWTLQKIVAFAPTDENQGLKLAAGLEQNSDHFIGREILRQAQKRNIEPASIDEIQTEENGVIGRFDGDIVKIGSAGFLKDMTDKFNKLPESVGNQQGSAYSYVYMSIADRPAAVFFFGDSIRNGARATVEKLHQQGFELALVSGDGIETTRAIAKDLGIHDVYGGQMPTDKVAIVKTLQGRNQRVAMVGDGINDAPALVQADLSLAVHSGANLGEEVADVTLMRAEPEQLIDFLNFAGAVNKKISQNLIFTFAYNVISIPMAMSGLLTPLVAVSAMLLSSISVIGNTLMLVRKHSP